MTDPAFTRYAEVLGYSMMKQNTAAKKIMIVLRDKLTETLQHTLEKVGWTTIPVDPIKQPGEQAKTERYRLLYTKLRIWTLTNECDRAVYLDLDTLVLKNFEELFDILPATVKYAATPDNWFGTYTFGINAGVFVCKPDQAEFDRLMAAAQNTSHLDKDSVEQSFLSWYYGLTMLRLPFIYNANVAIEIYNKDDWISLKDDIKIIHYTIYKPIGKGRTESEPNLMWDKAEKEFLEWSKTN